MGRQLVIETLKIFPQDFEIDEFVEALYERVHALQGIVDSQNGNEKNIEDVIKELNTASSNN